MEGINLHTPKIKKIYIDFSNFSKKQFEKFWEYIFNSSDSFSLRFPNPYHSTSNTMDIEYDDLANICDEFVNYIQKNKVLINECTKNLIKKEITNRYLDDKYGNLSIVYNCKIFKSLHQYILNNPNLFDWLEPNLPEDLSFFKRDQLILYTCSHESICIFYSYDDREIALVKSLLC